MNILEDPEFLTYCALADGEIDEVEKYRSEGADIYRMSEVEHWNNLHKLLNTDEDSYVGVAYLIEQGLDVNAVDMYGNTPLHYAALWHHKDSIVALLAAGADYKIKNIDGLSPFRCCFQSNPVDFDCIKSFVDVGANPIEDTNNVGHTLQETVDILGGIPDEVRELINNASKSV